MIPGKRYTPELVLGIAWRRKWLILIPTVLVAAVACGITYMLPDEYRSETTILVVPQRVSESYVRSTVTTKIEDRLRSINQQVRSRTRLERIIEDFGLYAERRKTDIMQDIIDDMSDDIDVEIVQSDIFRVAFTSEKPRTAQQVTERLASFFIDDSLRDRTALAESASEFLESQLAEAARKLRDTEQKIADYKQKHDGELPTQADTNARSLDNAQSNMQSLLLQIDRDRDDQRALEKRIAELTEKLEAAASLPVVVQEAGASQSKTAQLEAFRAEFQRLQTKYQKGFPEYDRAAEKLARLEQEAAEESAGATPLSDAVPSNPITARIQRDLDEARTELDRVKRQIQRRNDDQTRLRGLMGTYQRRLELAPTRDSELVDLGRDYETFKSNYDSLLTKRIDSQLSANLERRQIGEQFKTLDQARLPEKPSSPNRPSLYLMSIIGAIALGLLAAAAAEYLDHGLRSEDDVRLALALPVLATIPVIGSTKKAKLTLWRKVAAGSAAVVVLAAAVGAVWFSLR